MSACFFTVVLRAVEDWGDLCEERLVFSAVAGLDVFAGASVTAEVSVCSALSEASPDDLALVELEVAFED